MYGLAGLQSDESESDYESRRILERVGAFLDSQHLPATPANYAFVFRFITEPQSAFAQAVRSRTADGVRLLQSDIELLDEGHSNGQRSVLAARAPTRQETLRRLDRLQRVAAALTREIDHVQQELPRP